MLSSALFLLSLYPFSVHGIICKTVPKNFAPDYENCVTTINFLSRLSFQPDSPFQRRRTWSRPGDLSNSDRYSFVSLPAVIHIGNMHDDHQCALIVDTQRGDLTAKDTFDFSDVLYTAEDVNVQCVRGRRTDQGGYGFVGSKRKLTVTVGNMAHVWDQHAFTEIKSWIHYGEKVNGMMGWKVSGDEREPGAAAQGDDDDEGWATGAPGSQHGPTGPPRTPQWPGPATPQSPSHGQNPDPNEDDVDDGAGGIGAVAAQNSTWPAWDSDDEPGDRIGTTVHPGRLRRRT